MNGIFSEGKPVKQLFLLEQTENNYYDTYDSMVVVAESVAEAIRISPSDCYEWDEGGFWEFVYHDGRRSREAHRSWALHIENIKVTFLGDADPKLEKGIICKSYNAG